MEKRKGVQFPFSIACNQQYSIPFLGGKEGGFESLFVLYLFLLLLWKKGGGKGGVGAYLERRNLTADKSLCSGGG